MLDIALVNYLDLELMDPDGVIYYPFTLSGLGLLLLAAMMYRKRPAV